MIVEDYEEMDYEESEAPVIKHEMRPPVAAITKQETFVKKEMQHVKQEPQRRIELLTKFTKVEFLESCCLLNQADVSSPNAHLATCVHYAKCTIEVAFDEFL